MNQISFYIGEVIEGKNSLLFETSKGFIFYEKLANTIHLGKKEELNILQNKVESVKYNPCFESDSLKKAKSKNLESLLLNITENCNLSCSYCIYSGKYINERRNNPSKMSFETAKRAIDIFFPLLNKMALIGFYGGEPLMNMDLIKKIIKYSRKAYPEKIPIFSMTSNFCDVSLDTIKDIIENEIYINVSLDGPKQIHDKNRVFKNGKPTYDKIMENLTRVEEISTEYIKTHFFMNVTYKYLLDLPEIIKFFQENNQFNISRFSRIELKGLKEEIKEDIEISRLYLFSLASDYINSILSKRDSSLLGKFFDRGLEKVAIRNMDEMPERLMLDGCCYPDKHKLFVDTDGQFYICEKFGKRVSIGDVHKGINQNLIYEVIKEFLTIRNEYCTNGCWAQRLCTPCIQSSKDPKGGISKSGLSQICHSNKSQILIDFANYVSLIKSNKELTKNYINSIQFKSGR